MTRRAGTVRQVPAGARRVRVPRAVSEGGLLYSPTHGDAEPVKSVSKNPGALRYALLGLLAGSPGTGYELKKRFSVELADAWYAETSQIYPELARLSADGLISETSRGVRGSRTYTITNDGMAELVRWLRETEPNRATRNEALMRLFFFFVLDDAESEELFRAERDYHQQVLGRYQGWKDFLSRSKLYRERFNWIVVEWGIRYEEAFIEWLDWAEKEAKRARRTRRLSDKRGSAAAARASSTTAM
jgi:PadR family transcriptional regulator, regulatory protein AphA